MSRKKIIIIIVSILSILSLLLTGFTTYVAMDNNKYKDKFFPGIIVNDVNLHGKNLSEAIESIQSTIMLEHSFTLTKAEDTWIIPLDEIIEYDIETTLNDILDNKQIKGFWASFSMRKDLKKNPEVFNVEVVFKNRLNELVEHIKAEFDVDPVGAEFLISNDKKVSITSHKNGYFLSSEETVNNIKNELSNNSYTTEVVYEIVEPSTTTESLKSLRVEDHLFSTTTSYSGTGENRIFNIQRAASEIINFLVLPGETFSYNEVIGPANKAGGYKEATIIVNGKFVPGYGGGVCQLSSHIYWGVLKANLEVVQRRNHGRAVAYMPLGLDATVAYPYLDLKFRNNTPYGVILNTVTTPTHLTVDFYSYKPHYPEEVKFEHDTQVIPYTTQYNTNKKLPHGERKVVQKGSNGYKVTTYRILTQDGSTKRELINTDTYKALPQIIEINPKSNEND